PAGRGGPSSRAQGRARRGPLQHHPLLHQGVSGAHHDHRERDHPAQGACGRPLLRSGDEVPAHVQVVAPRKTRRTNMAITRRQALIGGAATMVAAGIGSSGGASAAQKVVTKGRLKQSVLRWCYGKIPMPEFCKAVADMGLTAIDLLEEPDWAVVRDHGLVCSMAYAGGGSIRDGLNVKANHDAIVR